MNDLPELPPDIPEDAKTLTPPPLKRVPVKRGNYVINKDFQYKFIFYTFIPTAFCLTVFYVSLQYYYSKLIQEGIVSGLPVEHPYFTLVAEQLKFMNLIFAVCGVSSFLFFLIWGIFISHKIAGPLYRLTKFFNDAKPGMIQNDLSFRPGDFFLEIPVAINGWIKRSKENQ